MMGQFFFFTRILARVQNSSLDLEGCYFFGLCSIPKIQRPSKVQSKNRKIDEEILASRRFYLFCQVLRPCSIEYTKMELLYNGAVFLFH